jgi:hypothetical protein
MKRSLKLNRNKMAFVLGQFDVEFWETLRSFRQKSLINLLFYIFFIIKKLWDNEIPFVFVTNGTYSHSDLKDSLTSILEIPLTNDSIIVAPSPCLGLHEYHKKHILVCCQESGVNLIPE